jgi:hypothetical protein
MLLSVQCFTDNVLFDLVSPERRTMKSATSKLCVFATLIVLVMSMEATWTTVPQTQVSRLPILIGADKGNNDTAMSQQWSGWEQSGAKVSDLYDDIVQEFLSQVAYMEANKANCTPGVTFNLGEGIIAQYGLQRYRAQAMLAVNRANLLTRLWKLAAATDDIVSGDEIKRQADVQTTENEWPEERLMQVEAGDHVRNLLHSEYFLYSQVRSMIESDPNVFGAGNCYDAYEYKNYSLFCAYGYRSNHSDPRVITVKDLSVGYHFLGNDSEFFYLPRTKANKKLTSHYGQIIGRLSSLLMFLGVSCTIYATL